MREGLRGFTKQMHEALGCPSTRGPGVVVLSTLGKWRQKDQEAVRGRPRLHSAFKTYLGDMRSCLKKGRVTSTCMFSFCEVPCDSTWKGPACGCGAAPWWPGWSSYPGGRQCSQCATSVAPPRPSSSPGSCDNNELVSASSP